jgi:hypothetical protein
MKYALTCLAIVLFSSCTASKGCTSRENKKQINKARRALEKKVYYVQSQFAIVNNQIVIFENGAQ